MGLEAKCVAKVGRAKEQGLARLEEQELYFKGAGGLRLKIPLAGAKTEAARGVLTIRWSDGSAQFELGAAAAEKWALKIRYPRGRMDKLGVKPGMRVSVLGLREKAFWKELEERTDGASDGKVLPDSDLIFFHAADATGLKRLRELKRAILPAGAVWVVWPKGRPEIKEDHIRAAALRAELVDVKVCAFSETLSALKLMIPRAKR